MRISKVMRALVVGAASTVLLLGSGCVVHEYRPDGYAYAENQAPTRYYAYYGPHVIPEQYGGGWCFIRGLHYHVYPPDYSEYYQSDDGCYTYQGPVSFYYYGPHPIPAADGGGWCYIQGRHIHHYHPSDNLGWHYSPTYRYYYWDPSHPDVDNGRYHPAEPVYQQSHPSYVSGHPVRRPGGGYAGTPVTATPVHGTPVHAGRPSLGHPIHIGTPVAGGTVGRPVGRPPIVRPADPGIGNGRPVPGTIDLGPIEGSGNGQPSFHPVPAPNRPNTPSRPSFHPVPAPNHPAPPSMPTFHPVPAPTRPNIPSRPTFHPVPAPNRPSFPSGPTFHPIQRPAPPTRPTPPSRPSYPSIPRRPAPVYGGGNHSGGLHPPVSRPPVFGQSGPSIHSFHRASSRPAAPSRSRGGSRGRSTARSHPAVHFHASHAVRRRRH